MTNDQAFKCYAETDVRARSLTGCIYGAPARDIVDASDYTPTHGLRSPSSQRLPCTRTLVWHPW